MQLSQHQSSGIIGHVTGIIAGRRSQYRVRRLRSGQHHLSQYPNCHTSAIKLNSTVGNSGVVCFGIRRPERQRDLHRVRADPDRDTAA
jgi:hypothetical protein